MKLDPLGEFTYTPQPKDERHFWEKWGDTTPQPTPPASNGGFSIRPRQ